MASIFTKAASAIDKSVVRFMERRMAPRARSTRTQIDPDARGKLIQVAAAYSKDTLGLPSRFFPEPDPIAAKVVSVGDGPNGTQIADISWPSTYQPYLSVARELYDAVPENHTAHARWWTSAGRQPSQGRPTIVLLHGWGAGNHWMTARAFMVPYWLRHGFDVAAFVLPYHALRAPAGRMGSNALFPSPNPLRTNEGFGQAIYDLRALATFLRDRGASTVGAMGMSLGGYTTSLWASVAGTGDVGGIDFAVAIIPAVSMARLMWRHGETSPMRARATKVGITEDLLVDAFAVHTPTTRPVRIPKSHLAIIAGHGDRITPPEQAEALAKHWGIDIAWFEGGHLAQVGRNDAMRAVRRQLGALGFAGREFRP